MSNSFPIPCHVAGDGKVNHIYIVGPRAGHVKLGPTWARPGPGLIIRIIAIIVRTIAIIARTIMLNIRRLFWP